MLHLMAQSTTSGGGNFLGLLAPLVLMGGLFYFLLIRPQQRRSRAQKDLLSSVDVGDEVMTVGGIFGVVTDIDEDTDVVTIEIAPGTKVRMVRRGISQKIEDEPDDYDGGDEDEDAEQAR
jgi:preprotein translocase subunit YajC